MPSVKLRQDNVRSLPYIGSGPTQCIYWDETLKGFGVRVHIGGTRSYVCAYRVQRRRRIAKLGRVDLMPMDDARRKAKQYLGRAAANSDPQTETDLERVAIDIKSLIAEYLNRYAKPKKKTWSHDQSLLNRLLLPTCGSRLASSIRASDIEGIHTAKGVKHPGEANNFLRVVRKMFNWARSVGLVPQDFANPATGIVMFRITRRRRYVTAAEMPRVLAEIEADENEYARHALWLLLLTGVRVNECLRAKWSDVDWDFRTLFIGLTKNGEPLLAPLSDAAMDRLKRIPRMQTNPYIIWGENPGTHLVNLGKPWGRIRKAAGCADVRLHDLRRTVGSWLAQQGSTLHLVGAVLNHKDQKTTAGYAYFQTHQRQQALTEHGRNVLKFGPAQPASAAREYEVESTKALPSLQSLTVEPHAFYIEREVMYRLVWDSPVREVAKRFGVSDVALAKACRRASVPIPSRGYWARVEGGASVERPPLGPAPLNVPERIRIRRRVLNWPRPKQQHQEPRRENETTTAR